MVLIRLGFSGVVLVLKSDTLLDALAIGFKSKRYKEILEEMMHDEQTTAIGFEKRRKQNRIKTSYGATVVLQATIKSCSATTKARH